MKKRNSGNRKNAGRKMFRPAPLIGKLLSISPDPPAVNRRPWHETTLVINLDPGGGVLGNIQIAQLLVAQELLASAENLNISYRWARVYTGAVNTVSALTYAPELEVFFSTLVPVATTGASTAGATVTSTVNATDTGTSTKPARLGFKFGELGRVPINGAVGVAILNIKNPDLPTLVHLHLRWNNSGYAVP